MSASVDWEFWKDSAWQLSLRVFHVVAILSWLGLQSYEDSIGLFSLLLRWSSHMLGTQQ